ncbi:hypothetical protein Q8A67_006536 [Cirrhinus molitorella]|uniref:Uncharacterized protein n=1 Tax=Cirrhinus molitorella TaxID=172907 RepID=A0AA88TUL7_9TELE|nr:hypothetical protein Q8A67_006536 [Cirrhinus molitorella]
MRPICFALVSSANQNNNLGSASCPDRQIMGGPCTPSANHGADRRIYTRRRGNSQQEDLVQGCKRLEQHPLLYNSRLYKGEGKGHWRTGHLQGVFSLSQGPE